MTPLVKDELTGPRAAGYLPIIEFSAARRAATLSLITELSKKITELDAIFGHDGYSFLGNAIAAKIRTPLLSNYLLVYRG
jgi:hypothetical protein